MKVLLTEGSGLTSRQVGGLWAAAGHDIRVPSSDPSALTRFAQGVSHRRRIDGRAPDPGVAVSADMRTIIRITYGGQRLITLIAAIVILIGCTPAESSTGSGGGSKADESKTAPKEVRPPAYGRKILSRIRVEVRLEKVILHQLDRAELYLVFARPDDAQPFPKDGHELPPSLQVWTVVSSNAKNSIELEAGTGFCDKGYPRRCTTELVKSEQGAAVERRIKVLFNDGAYGSAVITTPKLAPLTPPRVFDWLAEAAQFTVTFGDVGADEYEITYTGCGTPENAGVNPCSSRQLTITRAGSVWKIAPDRDAPGTRVRLEPNNEPGSTSTAKVIQVVTPFARFGADKQTVHVIARDKTRQGQTELWREAWDESPGAPRVVPFHPTK